MSTRAKPKPAPTVASRNFTGFSPDALTFLRDLALNNDPAWFKPRRDEYETLVRGPMIALVADVMTLAAEAGLQLAGDPAKAVFRIHRDVRFSADKSPYKTHIGASMTRTGVKLAPGLLYIHIEPGRCFVGAGFWHVEPPLLEAMRRKMLAAPDAFMAIVRALDKAGLPIGPDDEALKRLPRGFEAARDTPVEPFIRQRNLTARQSLPDAMLADPALPDFVLERYRAAMPLLEFGWSAVPRH